MAKRGAKYALRRTMFPWKPKETIDELVELAPRYALDEVIFKIDSEEFSHGLYTVDLVKPFIPWLAEARERLAGIGVAMSVNPWVTLVHVERGRDCRAAHPGMDWMVGHDGTISKASPCPLSPAWRELMGEIYALFASTKPRVLWLEDDIRTFHHPPVEFSCFCDLHLAAFERRTGKRRTREELVANILAPGEPHEDRVQWFDLLGETMVDVAAVFEKAVHQVNPETHLGLMTSHPNHHAAEGRRWEDFCRALAGDRTLVVRPCMGNYNESNARGLYVADALVRRTLVCLPRPIETQTEMESMPFTLFAKSVAFTRLQNLMSFVLGSDAVTMNMFDHCGSPMEDWPQYGRMLAAAKPFLNAITERALPDARERGVGLLHHNRGADATVLSENADFPDLVQKGDGWREALQAMGLTTTFQDAPVRAVTGQILRAFPREDVDRFLSQGLLLDVSAARTLLDMGMGEAIGLTGAEPFNKLDIALSAEENLESEFGGPDTYQTMTSLTQRRDFASLSLADGARAISVYVDPDRNRRMPAMVLFENDLGGRVAVCAADLSDGAGIPFLNQYRRKQLHAITRWLGRGVAPLFVEADAWPWAVRRDYDEYTIVAVANLTLDPWTEFAMTLSLDGRRFGKIERAHDDGAWKKCPPHKREELDGHATLSFNSPVAPADMIVYALWA